jgi:multicomponent Na+:H+ antiporter subunit D
MKGGLFMVVGIIVYRTGIEDIRSLRGLGRKMPVTMAAFTAMSLSMIGVPLTVGFISKWYLTVGAVEAGKWFIVPVILISSVLTAIYFWRIVESIYFGQPDEIKIKKAPVAMTVTTLIVAALCITFGIAATIPTTIAKLAAAALLGLGGGSL